MTRYLEQLNECTDPTTGDFLPIYDASAGSTDKDRKVNISRFGILANAQTFTALQTFAPTSGSSDALLINMQTANTAFAWKAKYNSLDRFSAMARATANQFILHDADLGSNNAGPGLVIGRNTAASLPGGSYIRMATRAGTEYYLWVDQNGKLRKGTTLPNNSNDLSGIILGTET